jgi:hypothetical protein
VTENEFRPVRLELVIGWMAAFAGALAFALVTRRTHAFVALVLLVVSAIYVLAAIRYGTH